MKKVLYYSLQKDDPTAFYRTSGVLPFIKHNDFELLDISGTVDFDWQTFIGADIFILQRPFNAQHVHLIKLAKDLGLKVITDYDDNLFALDEYNPCYDLYDSNRLNLKTCVTLSDEIWVSTPSIQQTLSKLNKNVIVIPNAHNDYVFKVEDKKPFNTKTKIAAWRGGASHEADVYEVADELVSLINNNLDWTFNFFGERFTYMELRCGNNYNSISAMSPIQFYKYLHNMNPNIVFFPLRNTQFNQGKSNICWLEAVYAGAVFVGNRELDEFNISYTGNFKHWVKEKWNDFLMDDLKQMNEDNWQHIQQNLLLSKINELRINSILSHL